MCMNRRLALTVAGATAVVVTAASGAMAANLSILGSDRSEPVGRLTAANVAELSVPAPAPRSASVGSDPAVDPTAASNAAEAGGTPTPTAPIPGRAVTGVTGSVAADPIPTPSVPGSGVSPSPTTTRPPVTTPTTPRRGEDREKEREKEREEGEDDDD